MAFAAIHIPNFILQSALRAHSELHARPESECPPVAIAEGAPPLERIVAANAAALSRGIDLGMPRSQVEGLHEQVSLLRRSPADEQAAHAALLDLGWACSPRVEDTAADSILIDLAGLAHLFGSDRQIAQRLLAAASQLDLSVHVAVAENLDAAFYAARGYSGITIVPAGEEALCLGPLPLAVLFPAQDENAQNTVEILDRWGVRTCAALAALPLLDLSERLGPEGIRLHELARGAASRSMILAESQTHFSEGMELEDAVAELEPLLFILGRLLDQLCARLEARALSAVAITVRFDLEPAPRPNRDGVSGKAPESGAVSNSFEKTMSLPVPMRDSKLLLTLLHLRLQSQPPPRAILKVTLTATPSAPRSAQGGLFLPPCPQPEKLELTIARLAHLVGEGNVGAPEIVDSHRPGDFRVRPFSLARRQPSGSRNPVREIPGKGHSRRRATARAASAAPFGVRAALPAALRTFRPPVPATVRIGNGRPERLTFRGVDGKVLAASGPWRSSGAWWEPRAWQCDEWDVEVEFPPMLEPVAQTPLPLPNAARENQSRRGVYRIFFDALLRRWFVRGEYD